MAERKYYRVTIHRYPPYSSINGSYFLTEDVYALSSEGAINSVNRYHKGGFGDTIPVDVKEITKEEFKGLHEMTILDRTSECEHNTLEDEEAER